MEWWIIAALIISGIFVGFINTLAGSGTIISMSLLMFLGLPPTVANGTNRVAVFFQNVVAVGSFSKQKLLDYSKGIWFSVPTAIGSLLGAFIAVKIDEKLFEKLIAIVMLILIVTILWKPDKWLKGNIEEAHAKVKPLQLLLFFLMGVYGGFIHMGVGIFILTITVLNAGYDLVKANAIKNLIVLLYTPITLVVFIVNGMVNFKFGLIHSIGNMIGAYLASVYGAKWGTGFIRWLLVIVIFLASAKLLGLFDIIRQIFLQ